MCMEVCAPSRTVLDPLIPVTSGGEGVDQDPILAAPDLWTPHIRYTDVFITLSDKYFLP